MQDMAGKKMKRKDFAPILTDFQHSEKHTAVRRRLCRWAGHLPGCYIPGICSSGWLFFFSFCEEFFCKGSTLLGKRHSDFGRIDRTGFNKVKNLHVESFLLD